MAPWDPSHGQVLINDPNDPLFNSAYAINNSGQVVGYHGSDYFVWTLSTGMQDLSSMVPTGWTLAPSTNSWNQYTGPISINDSGQIAVLGSYNGGPMEILILTPKSGAPSTISSNFNGTAINADRTIWFNSMVKAGGLGSNPVTITVSNASVTFAANGTTYKVPVPDATITFSPSATTASTVYDSGSNTWHTTVPSNLGGNMFLSGVALPVTTDLPGGINPVSWTGNFSSDSSGVTLSWAWAAAVYSDFTTDYNALGVKPVDSSSASSYQNSDHAGAPENYKSFVTGGARGGGGSNYTGGLSSTVVVKF